MSGTAALLLLVAAAAVDIEGVGTQPGAAPVLEYIAHASFVVQSPSGVRVVLDPFNSERWLGYTFPADVRADAVLMSHPGVARSRAR